MTWYLVVFTLRMLATVHGTGVIQVVKFPNAQLCQSTRTATGSDGLASVCTASQSDVQGFIAAMNCQDSHMSKLPDGTDVARFSCAPDLTVPK